MKLFSDAQFHICRQITPVKLCPQPGPVTTIEAYGLVAHLSKSLSCPQAGLPLHTKENVFVIFIQYAVLRCLIKLILRIADCPGDTAILMRYGISDIQQPVSLLDELPQLRRIYR